MTTFPYEATGCGSRLPRYPKRSLRRVRRSAACCRRWVATSSPPNAREGWGWTILWKALTTMEWATASMECILIKPSVATGSGAVVPAWLLLDSGVLHNQWCSSLTNSAQLWRGVRSPRSGLKAMPLDQHMEGGGGVLKVERRHSIGLISHYGYISKTSALRRHRHL